MDRTQGELTNLTLKYY